MRKEIPFPHSKVSILRETDVLVCGGGPAGVGAAVGSARCGLKTLLIEQYGVLGGTGTVGLVCIFMHTKGDDRGVFREVVEKLEKMEAIDENRYFDPEALKIVLLELLDKEKVDILFHTFICGTIVENGEVKGVYVANKSGISAILAKVVIDATGDGDVCFFAGTPFEKEKKENLQAVTLMFVIGGVDYDRLPKDTSFITKIAQEAKKKGEVNLPFYERPRLGFRGDKVRKGEMNVNIDMLIGIDGTDPEDLSLAEKECRKKVWELIKFYKKHIPGMENIYLVETATQVGIRETRRIKGLYTLTKEDVLNARKFSDNIAKASFFIDIHCAEQSLNWKEWIKKYSLPPGEWYEIPYRCLIPVYPENILVAGRCISADHWAQGSLRVMPTCMATGQAAGIAAALSIKKKCSLKDLDVNDIQRELRRQNAL